MQRNKENIDFPQIPLSKSVLLHLLPGILITIFYIIMVPLVTLLDFPNRLADLADNLRKELSLVLDNITFKKEEVIERKVKT